MKFLLQKLTARTLKHKVHCFGIYWRRNTFPYWFSCEIFVASIAFINLEPNFIFTHWHSFRIQIEDIIVMQKENSHVELRKEFLVKGIILNMFNYLGENQFYGTNGVNCKCRAAREGVTGPNRLASDHAMQPSLMGLWRQSPVKSKIIFHGSYEGILLEREEEPCLILIS